MTIIIYIMKLWRWVNQMGKRFRHHTSEHKRIINNRVRKRIKKFDSNPKIRWRIYFIRNYCVAILASKTTSKKNHLKTSYQAAIRNRETWISPQRCRRSPQRKRSKSLYTTWVRVHSWRTMTVSTETSFSTITETLDSLS